jgi:hypothetical protein
MLTAPARFQLHSIAVEIRGQGAAGLAQQFDFFTHRPSAQLPVVTAAPEAEHFSVTLELVPGPALKRRQGNFSYGTAPDPIAGFAFLRSEIRHFLERQNLHLLDALGIGLRSGDSLLVLVPESNRDALADALLAAGAGVLLSRQQTLIDAFGSAHPFPLQAGAAAPGLIVAPPIGTLARPEESFRPGHLVIASAGPTPSLKEIPRWRASYSLLRAFGLPAITTPARGAAAAVLLARSRTWRLVFSPDARASAATLATHGIK